MKKLALGAILGASLMISSSAFALTAMTDANMKSATGQAGVSIAIDNVVIEQFVGSTKYTDDSGAFDATAGSVVISDKHTVKTFLAMTSEVDYKKDFSKAIGTYVAAGTVRIPAVEAAPAVTGDNPYTAAVETDYIITPAVVAAPETTVTNTESYNGAKGTWKKASALSIDVGNCSALTAGFQSNITNLTNSLATLNAADINTEAGIKTYLMTQKGYTIDEATSAVEALANGIATADEKVVGVVIGLPTLLINTTQDEYTVGLEMTGAINNGDKFIKITKGNSTMAILGGTVEIAAH